jgi:CubicO group peptidase (beta-lactamase class C family)
LGIRTKLIKVRPAAAKSARLLYRVTSMRMSRRITSAVLLLLVTTSLPVAAQDASRMDEVLKYYVGEKLFMGSVLVVKDDKPVLDKAYGFANLEWNIPNSPETKFRLGSLTKQFTAAAILL